MTEYPELFSWIRQNGGYIHPGLICRSVAPGNRELKMLENCPADQKLIELPIACTITALGNEKCPLIVSEKLLREFSLEEKSFYYPYIRTLPTMDQFGSHPLNLYDQNDLAIIETICPEAQVQLANYHRILQDIDQHIAATDISPKYNTPEWRRYMGLLYLTRSWKSVGFIPLIDMLQHHWQGQAGRMLVTNTTATIFSLENITAGTAVCYNYKITSHIDLYCGYDIPASAREEVLKIPIAIPNMLPATRDRLKEYGLYSEPMQLTLTGYDLTAQALRIARILAGSSGDGTKVDNMDKELLALRFLLTILRQLKYPKSSVVPEKYRVFADMQQVSHDIVQKNIRYVYNFWHQYLNEVKNQ